MKIIKRSIYAHTKKWKRLVNLLFTNTLHSSECHMRHHFPKMNCSRQCRQSQFSSTAEFSNEMKLKSRLPPFSLTHIRVSTRVLFLVCSIIFYLWVNSDNIILWQTRHTGSFLIPCLGLCPLLTNRKILPGQSDNDISYRGQSSSRSV